MPSLLPSPFDPVSGKLLPAYRKQYVRGRLSADLRQPIEAYLAGSPVQANIVLAQAQALAVVAQAEEQEFAPSPWVQQRLRYQPAVSGSGLLRRPVVQLALGLPLLLVVASVVQWLRNKPLLPTPVVQAVVQVTQSATQATRHLVQQLMAPPAPALGAAVPALPAKPPRLHRSRVHQPAAVAPIQARVAVATPLPTDSAAGALPGPPAPAATASVVRGRITDGKGRPLPGATVLLQGTGRIISADDAGDYELLAPVGSTLQFGYGGYADQLLRFPGGEPLNIVLQPSETIKRHR